MSASIQFVGNVGKDPESQYTPNGSMVTKFSVAVNNGYGEKKTTTWYNCEVWGEKPGEAVKQNVQKGSKVFVSGILNIRSWGSAEGEARTSNDVKINEWEVVSGRKPKDTAETPYDGEEGDPQG
jgi:single-strand DNA-binding protein